MACINDMNVNGGEQIQITFNSNNSVRLLRLQNMTVLLSVPNGIDAVGAVGGCGSGSATSDVPNLIVQNKTGGCGGTASGYNGVAIAGGGGGAGNSGNINSGNGGHAHISVASDGVNGLPGGGGGAGCVAGSAGGGGGIGIPSPVMSTFVFNTTVNLGGTVASGEAMYSTGGAGGNGGTAGHNGYIPPNDETAGWGGQYGGGGGGDVGTIGRKSEITPGGPPVVVFRYIV
jgi:hypothetical protein